MMRNWPTRARIVTRRLGRMRGTASPRAFLTLVTRQAATKIRTSIAGRRQACALLGVLDVVCGPARPRVL